jgi:hypothetical protein
MKIFKLTIKHFCKEITETQSSNKIINKYLKEKEVNERDSELTSVISDVFITLFRKFIIL